MKDRLIRKFIKHTPDFHKIDPKTGQSPIHDAVDDGESVLVEFLLAQGVNINVQDRDGWTPLHFAVDHDIQEATINGKLPNALPLSELLIQAGADESITNCDGKTARDIALEYEETTLYDKIKRPTTIKN